MRFFFFGTALQLPYRAPDKVLRAHKNDMDFQTLCEIFYLFHFSVRDFFPPIFEMIVK